MKNKFKKRIAMTMIITTSIMMATTAFGAKLKTSYNVETKKWGLKDASGKEVVSAIYDGVNEFINGYIPVKKNNLWGFVDENGKEVVPTIYNGVSHFHGGNAPVIKNGVWGIINAAGEEVIPFKYQEIYYFDSKGVANAKKDGKWGKIDKSDNIVVPFIYEKADRNTKYTETTSKVKLDGVEVEFHAYNINNNNYVKIRDIAKVLDGSEKQFEVSWNKEKGIVDLLSGEPYTAVGGELEKNDKKVKGNLRFTESPIAKDGQNIILKGYNLGDSNYFKIRDIAKEFNIGLTWNQQTKTIELDTTADYIE